MRILTVVGARPQFIKAALLSEAFAYHDIEEILVHTGQHYDTNMSDVFFRELKLRTPEYFLEVGSGSHAQQTANIMLRLEPVIDAVIPDLVVVYGDTNSTIAGALVAAKRTIPVAHVEAGLRSFDRSMPEEINRIATDHLSEFLFVPTERSRVQLNQEGIREEVHVVGDLMADLAIRTAHEIPTNVFTEEYAVATIHRASNTDDRGAFERIITGLRLLPMPVIFPVHPRTMPLVRELGVGRDDNIMVRDPFSYREMIAAIKSARVVLTDSGGLQKEAVILGIPCVTLRKETEWVETLAGGWNVLVGTDSEAIVRAATREKPATLIQPFGIGKCAKSIAKILAGADTVACAS